jgi:hypothetical protein
MHRRIEIDWALASMTPKAVPAAPLGLRARQCHADADVEAAAAIVVPSNIAMRKRLIIALLVAITSDSAAFLLTALVLVSVTLSNVPISWYGAEIAHNLVASNTIRAAAICSAVHSPVDASNTPRCQRPPYSCFRGIQ